MPFHSGLALRAGDEVLVLHPIEDEVVRHDRFDSLVAMSPVLDLAEPMDVETFFERAAATLSAKLGLESTVIVDALMDREMTSSTVLAPGLAVPHILIPDVQGFHLLIARCAGGVRFPDHADPVQLIFVIVGHHEERNFHLRALSAIAQIVQEEGFEAKWAAATSTEELQRVILHADRRRFAEEDFAFVLSSRLS